MSFRIILAISGDDSNLPSQKSTLIDAFSSSDCENRNKCVFSRLPVSNIAYRFNILFLNPSIFISGNNCVLQRFKIVSYLLFKSIFKSLCSFFFLWFFCGWYFTCFYFVCISAMFLFRILAHPKFLFSCMNLRNIDQYMDPFQRNRESFSHQLMFLSSE